MTYEDIVFAWNAQHANNGPLVGDGRMWDAITDRERIEFALSLAWRVEKQEPVAEVEHEEPDEPISWKRAKLNEAGLKLPHGTKLYTSPQPCPSCLEKQEEFTQFHNIAHGRFAKKVERVKELENTLFHLEVRMARVYMEVTGGKCSKDTPASSVIALYGEHLNERIKEALKDHTAEVLNGVLLELQLLESGSAPFFNSIGQAIEVVKSMRDRK